MTTLCTVVAVGNNAWLPDWCRLLIIRTLATATEPEGPGLLLVRSDAVARPPRISDARGDRRHADGGVRSHHMTARDVACRVGGLIACGLPQRFPTSA